MTKSDMKRMLALSKSGVSDVVIFHAIIQLCNGNDAAAAQHIAEFLIQKPPKLKIVLDN